MPQGSDKGDKPSGRAIGNNGNRVVSSVTNIAIVGGWLPLTVVVAWSFRVPVQVE